MLLKICGITRLTDALHAVNEGASALGFVFWRHSPRQVAPDRAAEIIAELPSTVMAVGVFVNEPVDGIRAIVAQAGLTAVQLHGDEPPEALAPFLPHAYKALRVRGPDVLDEAARYPGEHILLDAYVPGQPGGTGATFDWKLARELASRRPLTLAGGLTPDNVARAVTEVRPFCVDVASGVERAPGVKDLELVRRFIEAARSVPE